MESTRTPKNIDAEHHRFIRNTVNIIASTFDPVKVILFGSHASGNFNEDSDVDFLVIMDSDKSSWQISADISQALPHALPLDIIVRTPEEIEHRLSLGDFFIQDIMKNGKVLFERAC